MDPLVSFVIPAYRPEFLLETLGTILRQTYENIEVIVTDDCEDDAVSCVVDQFDDKRLWYVKNNKPDDERVECVARSNFLNGFQIACGDFVRLVCDDDVITEESTRKYLDVMEAHPEVSLVTSYRSLIRPSGRVRGLKLLSFGESVIIEGKRAFNTMMCFANNFVGETCSSMMRRDKLADDPFVFQGVEVNALLDVVLWINLMLRGDWAYIQGTMSSVREHDTQMVKNEKVRRRCVKMWETLRKASVAAECFHEPISGTVISIHGGEICPDYLKAHSRSL